MKDHPDSTDPSMDGSRYRDLFEAHFADVWTFARRRSPTAHDADDVTAETFAIAWRKRHDLPWKDARLWLFGTARRVLANQRRSNERQRHVRLRLAENGGGQAVMDDLPDQHDTVWKAFKCLSSSDRDLLMMQAWDGLSIAEMAVILDCTANAVSIRLHKARRKLVRELERKERTPPGHVAGGSPSAEGGLS